MKRTLILAHQEARRRAVEAVMSAPEGFAVTVGEATRSLDQNALLWPLLTEISNQVIWHGRKLDAESWKHVFSSALRKQDVVPNIDGTGFVVLGVSTSKMSKREFGELIELVYAFGAEHGVKFSDERKAAKGKIV